MNSKAYKFLSSLAIMLLLSVKLLGVHALIHASENMTIDECELCEVVVKDIQESLSSDVVTDYETEPLLESYFIETVTAYNSVAYRHSFSLQVLSRPPPRV